MLSRDVSPIFFPDKFKNANRTWKEPTELNFSLVIEFELILRTRTSEVQERCTRCVATTVLAETCQPTQTWTTEASIYAKCGGTFIFFSNNIFFFSHIHALIEEKVWFTVGNLKAFEELSDDSFATVNYFVLQY